MKSAIRKEIEKIVPALKGSFTVYVDGYDTKFGRRYRMKWARAPHFSPSDRSKILSLPHVVRVKHSRDGYKPSHREWSGGPVVIFDIPPSKIVLTSTYPVKATQTLHCKVVKDTHIPVSEKPVKKTPIPGKVPVTPSKHEKISLDIAKQILGKNPTIDAILKEMYTDQELGLEPIFPKTYEEVKDKSGWEFSRYGSLLKVEGSYPVSKTVAQAYTGEAYKKLTQAMEEYTRGWQPNWRSSSQLKFCIVRVNDQIEIFTYLNTFSFLAFPTEKIAREFYKNFEHLIKKFYQLG